MRKQLPFTIPALADSVDQPPAKFQNLRVTENVLFARTAQETRFHLGSNRPVARAQASDNGKPHRHVGSGHENLPTHYSAWPLQVLVKRHQDSALAIRERMKLESVVL